MENYLHSNDREGRIKKLKKILIALGYRIINESGEFDERTRRAVRSYQNDHKIRTTGIVDKYTWDALQKSYALLTERSVENEGINSAMPQATPISEPVAAPASESVPVSQPAIMPEPVIQPAIMPEPVIHQEPELIPQSDPMSKSKPMDGYMPSPEFADKPEPYMFLGSEPIPAPQPYSESEMLPQKTLIPYPESNPEVIPAAAQIPSSYPMPESVPMYYPDHQADHVCKCKNMPNVVPAPDDHDCRCRFTDTSKFEGKNRSQYEMHEYIHNHEPADLYKYLK